MKVAVRPILSGIEGRYSVEVNLRLTAEVAEVPERKEYVATLLGRTGRSATDATPHRTVDALRRMLEFDLEAMMDDKYPEINPSVGDRS